MQKSFPLPFSSFNENAEKYANSEIHAQGVDLERIKELVLDKPGALVLDIGSGAGHVTFTVAPHVSWVIALDPAANMLQKVVEGAKERGLTNVLTRQGFSECLDFQDKSADIVITRFSIHHWDSLAESFKEINRVLKDDGKLIIVDTVAPEDDLLDTWLNAIELTRDTSHVRNRKVSELVTLLEMEDFELTDIRDFKFYVCFENWINRTSTSKEFSNHILMLQNKSPIAVQNYFNFDINGDFEMDYSLLVCDKKSC